MTLWAIVPIKPLRRGKSRLSQVLSETEREQLNQTLLVHTLHCLSQVPEIDHNIMVSYDPAALSLAREYGFRTIQENKRTTINIALRKGTLAAKAFKATKVLIIPADLPFLTVEVIREMISHSRAAPEIIIAPDRKKDGTNALLVNPVGILDYDFGEWSFRKHIEQAERKKIRIEIFEHDDLSFDLDIPDDYEYLKKSGVLDGLLATNK